MTGHAVVSISGIDPALARRSRARYWQPVTADRVRAHIDVQTALSSDPSAAPCSLNWLVQTPPTRWSHRIGKRDVDSFLVASQPHR